MQGGVGIADELDDPLARLDEPDSQVPAYVRQRCVRVTREQLDARGGGRAYPRRTGRPGERHRPVAIHRRHHRGRGATSDSRHTHDSAPDLLRDGPREVGQPFHGVGLGQLSEIGEHPRQQVRARTTPPTTAFGSATASRPASTGRVEPAALAAYWASSAQESSCSRETGPLARLLLATPTATPRTYGHVARQRDEVLGDGKRLVGVALDHDAELVTADPTGERARSAVRPPGDSAAATARSAASPWAWVKASLAALSPLTSAITTETGRWSAAPSTRSRRSSMRRRLPKPVSGSE